MTAQADQRVPQVHGATVRRLTAANGPTRTARVLVEVDLTGGGAPGIASALCAEISDLLAGHARAGDTTVSALVSLGFGDDAARPPSAPVFSARDDGTPVPDATVDARPGAATRGAAVAARRSDAGTPPLRILAGRRVATLAGSELSLTRREFDLLAFLARHPRQVFSRTQLIDAVWGARFRYSERTIDVHVRRLRVKLADTGPQIVTVRGVGYRLDHADRVAVLPGVD
ncbi:winged helix-turn-helix domain-containing protein [Cryptosporangium aurantiacum]|uniref:Transcriptional regulatory protein, C terminal n=1 Tax=Cryptosporangium aurantiacum TaxID=134849 RepID=A0A1M7TUR1_9ACTN|nr:winged helix-turn-helix domain-containing protein [Cryptosporangium aurantiacum]SHN74440.1 Transcriptional regulatory protein, C terminal [Cryptosporangium aurantiacum]